MKIIYQTTLSVKEFIYNQGWKEENLDRSPNSNKTSCLFHCQETYSCKSPLDMRMI